VRGGGPFDEDPRLQGFGSGLFSDPTGHKNDSVGKYGDQIRIGLTGNLRDYVLRPGVTGKDVDYNGSPTGYALDPSESVQYVDAHDNETLYDALAFKLPQSTPMATRVRMNTLSLATVALGQGTAFFHAGSEILRSKSLDRNSYDSGDWFNRVDWSLRDNTFGSGLPPKRDNEAKWPFMKPLLADPSLDPTTVAMRTARDRFQELLRVRTSSPLLRLGSAALISQRLAFPTSANSTDGVITMVVDDTGGTDLDPGSEGLVVVFNATGSATTQSVPGAAGASYALHAAQAGGGDAVVKSSSFASGAGSFTVPARTVAVFVRR
jgi:pullulanase/glycogen debranching enzyme